MIDLACTLTYGDNQVRDELVRVHDGELNGILAQARGDGHRDGQIQFYGDGALALIHGDAFHDELVLVSCAHARDRLAPVYKCQALLRDK